MRYFRDRRSSSVVFFFSLADDAVAEDCKVFLLIRTDSSVVGMVWMTAPGWFPVPSPLCCQPRSAEQQGEEICSDVPHRTTEPFFSPLHLHVVVVPHKVSVVLDDGGRFNQKWIWFSH